VQAGLSTTERKLCSLFSPGKHDRVVPILLTERIQSAVDLLNQNRSDADICQSNNFVFAIASSDRFLRGCDVVRKIAIQCGATEPSTST